MRTVRIGLRSCLRLSSEFISQSNIFFLIQATCTLVPSRGNSVLVVVPFICVLSSFKRG